MASTPSLATETLTPRKRLRLGYGRRWLSPIAILAIWELAARTGLVSEQTLSAPSAIFVTLWTLTISGVLPANLLVSLQRVVLGLAFGATAGGILAITAALSKIADEAIDPPVQMIRTLPSLALMPLLIVWLGIGEASKITLIALSTAFPIYINLYNGIRGIDSRLIECARSYRLTRAQTIRDVILPGAMPSLLVGFRYALSVSILVLVVAEQINASSGLGYLVNTARDFLQTDVILACLIVYAALGLASDGLIRLLERRLLAWRVAAAGNAQ